MNVRSLIIGGGVLLGAVLAACGGGGGGSSSVAPTSVTQSTAASAVFTISLGGSGTSSVARSPKFVDSATQSLSIAVSQVNGAAPATAIAPTIVNVGPTAAGCTTSGSTITCTVNVGAVVGSDTFTVTAYAQPNGAGAQLSTGSTTVAITQSGPNAGALVLGGIPASIAVSVTNGNNLIPGGYATTLPVVVSAKDASGATIIGTYANPITLTNADTSGTITVLSTNSVKASGATVTLAYNPTDANTGLLAISGLPVGATTIGASASGVAASAVTSGTFQYMADRFSGYNINSTFAGTATVVTTTYNATGTPSPSPSTWNYTLVQTNLGHATGTFNGAAIGYTEHSYSFTQTSPVTNAAPETQVVDDYRHQTLTATGSIDNEYGIVTSDSNAGTINSPFTGFVPGTSTQTFTFASSPWQIDVLPHAATSWANTTVPYTIGWTGAQVATWTAPGDGSYTFTQTLPTPAAQTEAVSGASTNNSASNAFAYTFSPPIPSGTGMVIPVVRQATSPTPGPTASFQAFDWYPNGGAVASPLLTDTFAVSALTTIPTTAGMCVGLAPSLASQPAWLVLETKNELRIPIFQLRQQIYAGVFITGVGQVCFVYSGTFTNYNFTTGIISSSTTQSEVGVLQPTQPGAINITERARASATLNGAHPK